MSSWWTEVAGGLLASRLVSIFCKNSAKAGSIYIKKLENKEIENKQRAKKKLTFLFEKSHIHTKVESGTHHGRYQNIRYANQIL